MPLGKSGRKNQRNHCKNWCNKGEKKLSKEEYLKGEKKLEAIQIIKTGLSVRMRPKEILQQLAKKGIEISERTYRRLKLEIYENSGKRSEKKIFDVFFKKKSKNQFLLTIRAEGGLPVKRFVMGDNVVPGVSQILDTCCNCEEFDFLEIQMITNNYSLLG